MAEGHAGRARRDRRPALRALSLLLLLLAFHAAVAWYPFTFDPPLPVDNGVQRLADGSLEFSGRRAFAVADPPAGLAGTGPASELTATLEFETTDRDQHGPARILTFSADHLNANLVVGQEGTTLVVRARRSGSDDLGRPPATVPDVFPTEGRVRAVIRLGGDGLIVHVDGREPVQVDTDAGAVAMWDQSFRIALGDESRAARVWHGTVHAAELEVDGVVTDYLAPGVLAVPDRVWYVPDRVYDLTRGPDESARRRSVLHLAGFIPVGVLLWRLGSHRRLRAARIIGATALFSLALQLGKVAIEGRHPSLLDLGAHVLGAVLGAVAAAAMASTRGGEDRAHRHHSWRATVSR